MSQKERDCQARDWQPNHEDIHRGLKQDAICDVKSTCTNCGKTQSFRKNKYHPNTKYKTFVCTCGTVNTNPTYTGEK